MSIVGDVLDVLFDLGQLLPRPLETKYAWNRRLKHLAWPQYDQAIRHLERRGVIKVSAENGKKFLQITSKGQLEVLLARAQLPEIVPWDGKWRLIMFDIPEDHREKRSIFRTLLKSSGFRLLQKSVYINPYPLNKSAIEYLKQTGLIKYIRILRVDGMDEDIGLMKIFNLK